MSRSTNDDEQEVRSLLDALGIAEESGTPSLDNAEWSRAERMLRQITEQVEPLQARPPSKPRRHNRWSRSMWRVALVATSVVALVTLSVFAIDPSSEDGSSVASAATPPLLPFSNVQANRLPEGEPAMALLADLAAAAARQPGPERGPVQHVQLDAWWASSEEAGDDGEVETVLFPTRVDSYFQADGELRLVERRGAAIDEEGRLHPGPVEWDAAGRISDTTFQAEPERAPDLVATLPRAPGLLAEELVPNGACPGRKAECLLGAVADLHATYVVPSRVVARLWRALAGEPTVTSLGRTRDRSGREAVVLSADPTSTTQVLLLVDPTTGRYLGTERVLVEPDPGLAFSPPAVVEFTSVLRARRITAVQVPGDEGTVRH